MSYLVLPFRLVGLALALCVALVRDHKRATAWTCAGLVTAAIVVGLCFTVDGLPVISVQRGFRGTGMFVEYNPRTLRGELAANLLQPPYPAVPPAGKSAADAYKNIKVLQDVDANELVRLMAAMSNWVAPSVGCSYCHTAGASLADDAVWTKTVARHMIEMTRDINTNWKSHVGAAGVTCGTCHRGHGVPLKIWHIMPAPGSGEGAADAGTGKNAPSEIAGDTSLPTDPLTPFLLGAAPIRVQSRTALPSGDNSSIKQTDWTYALMIHFAQSLGVGCNFCHNSRAFGMWDQGTPQRVTAWYGIRMVRDLNRRFMQPLRGVFPKGALGLYGDVGKIDCATCHQGAYEPYYGASALAAYPELEGPAPTRVALLPHAAGGTPATGGQP